MSSKKLSLGTDVGVNIRNLAFGGDGVGEVVDQANGETDLLGITAFVPFTAIGEKVQAKVNEQKKRFIKTTLVEIKEESPQRVTPLCEYFMECGGCELQHISYLEQLRAKHEMIVGAFRAAKVDSDLIEKIEQIVPSKEYGYRRRIALHVDSSGKVGLYREKTRSIVSIKKCEIVSTALNEVIEGIQDFGHLVKGVITSISLEEDSIGVIAILKSPYDLGDIELKKVLDSAKKFFKNVLVLVGERELGGFGRQILELPLNEKNTYSLKVPAGNFSQVNWDINLALIEKTLELANISYEQKVYDLYAGAGNFAIPLARNGAHVTAVESNPRLASFVNENAQKQSLSKKLIVEKSTVEQFLKTRQKQKVDLILADPPRSGLGALASQIPEADEMLLISCYLPSLVRDVRALISEGWKVETIVPFDMFPQTSYVEVITKLTYIK